MILNDDFLVDTLIKPYDSDLCWLSERHKRIWVSKF